MSSQAGGRGNTGTNISGILQHLATHGWVSLRQMSPLLGYAHPTCIYGRQKTKNPIQTIRIGGIYRVYADVVLHTLNNVPEEDQEAAQTFLRIYRGYLTEHEHKE